MICTFYSFKGGVGRSMALANIAELFYRHGARVLMVDFDLEAPGLERYFEGADAELRPDEILARRGLIDMLSSYQEIRALPATSDAAAVGGFAFSVEPLANFVVPIYPQSSATGGSLSLLPAGRRDGSTFTDYARRVRAFDWDDFYAREDGEKFFDWFRQEAEVIADFVLVDSRTGFTEMGGVCTYQLADVVVLFVAPNEQSLDGCRMMAESLSSDRLIEEGRYGRPLSLLFLPSRVEYGEAELLDQFALRFSSTFLQFSAYRPGSQRSFFDELKIPYVPYYAYMEKVAVREPERASASELIVAYERIAGALRTLSRKGESVHETGVGARVFLCYSMAEPGRTVAKQLRAVLDRRHKVFSDEDIPIGSPWAAVIEEELGRCDYLVAFLSAEVAQSERFGATIELAWRMSRAQTKPVILPVCLGERFLLPYNLDIYLSGIQWAYIPTVDATPRILREIEQAITNRLGKSAQADDMRPPELPSERLPPVPTGAVDLQSVFYVPRRSDGVVLKAIRKGGVTLVIRGARQTGKSSLLLRVLDAAKEVGKRAVYLDFQMMDSSARRYSPSFFRQFCSMLTDGLGMKDRVTHYWNESGSLSYGQKCTLYVERYLLNEVKEPLTIAIDEADAIFGTEVASEFFSMLRSWRNLWGRSGAWKRVDILLAITHEIYHATDPSISPFNIAKEVELADFAKEDIADLNRRYGSPLNGSEIEALMKLVGGQPHLVHLALHAVASGALLFEEIISRATDESGLFGDHLRSLAMSLQKQNLLAGFREILQKGTASDAMNLQLLNAAGLVRRSGQSVTPSNELYASYFRELLSHS